MPSWLEKPHTTPLINVNLKPCTCGDVRLLKDGERQHVSSCGGTPVLIPCPLPREAEFTVPFGACWSISNCGGWPHVDECPARPRRVRCSVGGDTWANSRVLNNGVARDGRLLPWGDASLAFDACRERWALVKALALGHWTNVLPPNFSSWDVLQPLFTQRDAMFAALCDMARAEQATLDAQERAVKAIGSPRLTASAREPNERPSAQSLSVYAEQLVEQVGVLA